MKKLNEQKPLPGPYEATPYDNHWSFACSTGLDDYDFRVDFCDTIGLKSQLATINLLEAAPDLLQACQMILDCNGDLDAMDFDMIRAAVKRAGAA